jgi:formamidopyrimidine-DNA glycosylase
MPELPDLTIFAESLQKLVLNKDISEVLCHKKQNLNVAPELFESSLKHHKFRTITRVGKELLFNLDNGAQFMVHLMLAGGFRLCRKESKVSFPLLTFSFDDGESLVIFDPKFLARIALDPDLKSWAIDALDVTSDYLEGAFKKKPRMAVKTFLLDQKMIAGIGNAYSDEILWDARISPKSEVGKIPQEAIIHLKASIKSVLSAATDHLRENHSGIMSGEVRDFLPVHNPKAKNSSTGHPIIIEQIASKKTYYTEEQILYK